MALITRISRIFRSDIHAVLDRIEDPGQLLRQAVREMDEALLQDERRCKLLQRDLQDIDPQRQDLDRQLARLDTELDLCFKSGKQDLARSLVKRKLEIERLVSTLEIRRQHLQQEVVTLDHRLQHNRTRLSSMQQKLEILDNKPVPGCAADTTADRYHIFSVPVSNEAVEIAYLQEQQKRAGS